MSRVSKPTDFPSAFCHDLPRLCTPRLTKQSGAPQVYSRLAEPWHQDPILSLLLPSDWRLSARTERGRRNCDDAEAGIIKIASLGNQ